MITEHLTKEIEMKGCSKDRKDGKECSKDGKDTDRTAFFVKGSANSLQDNNLYVSQQDLLKQAAFESQLQVVPAVTAR